MNRKETQLLEFKHTASYYFANMINNIFVQPINHIRFLHDFGGDELNINFSPFQKKSVFHDFIYYVIDSSVQEGCSEKGLEAFKIEKANEKYLPKKVVKREPIFLTDIEYYAYSYGFDVNNPWDYTSKSIPELSINDVYSYIEELPLTCEDYEPLILTIAREVFYILFSNRILLAKFNSLLSNVISDCKISEINPEYQHLFRKDGVLARKRIPEWARRAVFYRDKGLCVKCGKDISGMITNIYNAQIDHIVPLAAGGLNDVSNLQLLCNDCNLKKSGDSVSTNNRIVDWYAWRIE